MFFIRTDNHTVEEPNIELAQWQHPNHCIDRVVITSECKGKKAIKESACQAKELIDPENDTVAKKYF